jgi:tetratricopeptide (TPR) repeat protein
LTPEPAASRDLRNGMTELLDQSLLHRETRAHAEGEAGRSPRFTMLETIREYGLERLAECGEGAAIRRRHAEFFLALAESRSDHDLLAAEIDNLRAALDWAVENEQAELGLRLGVALELFADARGHLAEGQRQLTRLLALPGEKNPSLRARALATTAHHAVRCGDYETAEKCAEACLSIWQTLGEREGIAAALNRLGDVAGYRGDYGTARRLHADSLAIYRELGNRRRIAMVGSNLGYALRRQGEYELARPLLEECLAMKRELGDRWGTVTIMGNLGNLARCQGDYLASRSIFEEALAIGREMDNSQIIVHAAVSLGMVALKTGHLQEAKSLYQESLAIRRETGDEPGIADCLEGLAIIAAAHASPERAVRLSARAELLRASTGSVRNEPDFKIDFERHLTALRDTMGEEAFAMAWAEGRAISLQAAISDALEEGGPI